MSMNEYGISTTIKNYTSLTKIYDVLYRNYKIKIDKTENIVVYADEMLNDKKVELLQKDLTKKWNTYRLYRLYMSESEYKEYKKELQEERLRNKNNNRGIYGIYFKDELIYIGLTLRSFEERFWQHKNNLENNSEELFLYKYLRDKDYHNNLTLQPLINLNDVKSANRLNARDIQMMELALITLYQPLCNVQGKLKDYKISKTLVL